MAREKRDPLELRPADWRNVLKKRYKPPFSCHHDGLAGLCIIDSMDQHVITVAESGRNNKYTSSDFKRARQLCALLNYLSEKVGLCE